MIRSWSEIPLLRVAALFMAGIAAAMFCAPAEIWPFACGLILLLFCIEMAAPSSIPKHRIQIVLSLACVFFAGWQMQLQQAAGRRSDLAALQGEERHIVVDVLDSREGENSRRTEVKVIAWRDQEEDWKNTNETALFYFERGSAVEAGDRLLTRSRLQRIPPPLHPYQFDYAGFMAGKGIYTRAFVRKEDYLRIGKDPSGPGIFKQLKAFGMERLENHLPEDRHFAIMSGIVFGDKGNMSESQVDAFRKSGTAHVMAVSGMHVGLVYGIFWFLLKRVRRDRLWKKLCAATVALGGVWLFILTAGAPASAVRAGCMFSFFLSAQAFHLRYHSLNILCASAIILLIADPDLLTDIGFQFSHLAVAGIILFYASIRSVFDSGHRLLQLAWEGISISLAAQLAMLPLMVYYFGAFAPWFWLNSLFAAVLAFVCMSLAFLIILLSILLPGVANILGWVPALSIDLFSGLVGWTERLPFSFVESIELGEAPLLLLYCALILIVAYYHSRRWLWVFIAAGFMIVFAPLQLGQWGEESARPYLINLGSDQELLCYIVKGDQALRICGRPLEDDQWAWLAGDFERLEGVYRCRHIALDRYSPAVELDFGNGSIRFEPAGAAIRLKENNRGVRMQGSTIDSLLARGQKYYLNQK